jgi:hypothetical protein
VEEPEAVQLGDLARVQHRAPLGIRVVP